MTWKDSIKDSKTSEENPLKRRSCRKAGSFLGEIRMLSRELTSQPNWTGPGRWDTKQSRGMQSQE